MKHHRRRKLLKNLNAMYLDNYNASATYSEQNRLLAYMTIVSENLQRAEQEPPMPQIQLPLFPERELFGA